MTDTVEGEPLFSRPGGVLELTLSWGAFQRPLSLSPSQPLGAQCSPPVLAPAVMEPPPNRARGLDIRQAWDWLILAWGPPPAHEDIWQSWLPQALRGRASFSAATTVLHSPVTRQLATCLCSGFPGSESDTCSLCFPDCGGLL